MEHRTGIELSEQKSIIVEMKNLGDMLKKQIGGALGGLSQLSG